ncbi:hypothetical protein TRFO_19132 [Tritrichomonas foetus]|uniref:Uncharacterized protein n=1 Tax=Tritrichomonas foetus TaxID=1144522 RepID=A0A1J4KPQ0_9EUKA|nr:hypothetical protein TRFO_19132 [Tritrichomonas foetus]|eukprot:OHT11405.1 hypothetical protein TRFO_19132 [Tritrichomonas foetus]
MLRFVLAGPKGTGKSSIYSHLSPQATGSTKSGASQTIPIPMTLFSVVTLDFPSAITQRDSIPQVLSNAHAIIYCMKNPKDENLQQLKSLLTSCGLNPKQYILLHQIDRIEKEEQAQKIEESKQTAESVGIPHNHCFATSLFDGSLKRSFSQILADFLPQYTKLTRCVRNLASSFHPCHIIIVDAATFLPIYDSDPEKGEQPQPIFDFFLRIYSRKNPMKTLMFECNSSVVVYTALSKTTGIFVSSTNENAITTDAILFNVQRALPTLRELVKPEL